MNVLMTGSHGLIGRQLSCLLREAGDSVTALVRRPTTHPQERFWDCTAQELSPDLLAGGDVVIHLAGENIASGRWTSRKKQMISQSRIRTTQVLAETIHRMKEPPKVFLVASAIGYYGEGGSSPRTEESPPGEGFLASVCRDWEAAADAARQTTRVVQVRTGMVLSEQGGALKKMLLPFRLGIGGVIGSGEQFWSWITLTDLVRLYLFAITNEDIHGPVNGTSPEPVTCREFTRSLGNRLHRPTALPLPAWMARRLLGEMAGELILASCRVLPCVALSRGFQFEYPDLGAALQSLPL